MDHSDDLPPANGKPATIDPDGTVKGSGVGAGGGQGGEDFDEDPDAGSGHQPSTGFGTKE